MMTERKHVRRKAGDYYIVVDCHSEKILGRVMNMTIAGMMIATNQSMEVGECYTCRMALPEPVGGSRKVTFKAECRWTNANPVTGWQECGFRLFDLAPRDLEILEEVLDRWAIAESRSEPGSDEVKVDGKRPEIQVAKEPTQE